MRWGYPRHGWPCRARRRHPRGLRIRLLEYTQNLGFQFRKFHSHYNAAGMEDEIAACREQIHMAAENVSHTALDAVALVGLANNLANSQANTRSRWQRRAGMGRLLRG